MIIPAQTNPAAPRAIAVHMRNYAKYILREGTIFEKRELLSCLRSKLTMAKKEIKIA